MTEVIKDPPVTGADGQQLNAATGQAQTKPEDVATLKAANEALEKRLKDKDDFIGKQSGEIGDLRKKAESIDTQKATQEELSAVEKEVVQDLLKDGFTKEQAEDNAKIVVKGATRTINNLRKRQVMNDVGDMIEDAIEDKKFDPEFHSAHEKDIMAEFKTRKLEGTARNVFRIYKRCYTDVLKRKADEVRDKNKGEEEEKRGAMIDGSQTTVGTQKRSDADESADKKQRDSIKGAGATKNPVFF